MHVHEEQCGKKNQQYEKKIRGQQDPAKPNWEAISQLLRKGDWKTQQE
jgi:hypothetical protein